jgi:hypothetical protein
LRSPPDATELAVLLGTVKEWPENVVRAEPIGQRPSLTVPVRDGPENPWVGTEGWAPRAEQKDDLCRSSDRWNKESKKEVLVATFLFLTSPYKGAEERFILSNLLAVAFFHNQDPAGHCNLALSGRPLPT